VRKWIYSVVVGPIAQGDGNLEWHTDPALSAWLNDLGEQGWELVRLQSGDEKGLKGMIRPSKWVGVFKRQAGEVDRL